MQNGTENKITFVFIRHGETKSNIEKRYIGRNNNESLSEEGKSTLLKNKVLNSYPEGDMYFSSNKRRCQETMDIIYPGVKYESLKGLEEIDFGEFEGKNYEELKDDARYIKWMESNGTIAFPGGESRDDFIDRTVEAFDKALEKIDKFIDENPDKENPYFVFVVHGGTIMSIISEYSDLDYFDGMVAPGGGFICQATIDTEFKLEIINKF